MKIVCGKFDRHIDLSPCKSTDFRTKLRIGSNNPNKLTIPDYIPIATDGEKIIYSNEEFYAREFFFEKHSFEVNNLIVLTQKERNLILDLLLDNDLDVSVFESKYPIFSHIKFIPEIKKNYYELKRLIENIKEMNITGPSLANNLSTKNKFKVERKIRNKNKLDKFFYFGLQGGYQEVFKLREERKDRVIIALDFNSMYPSCMEGPFLDPSSIRYKKCGFIYSGNQCIEDGLYRVLLKGVKDSFFMNYHPFKYTVLGRSNYFKLGEEHQLETLLFRNEIDAYSQYFTEVEIIEGLVGTKKISHPLYHDAIKLYKKRKNADSKENKIMHDYYKLWLVMLHSATNPKRIQKMRFNSSAGLRKYLENKYMFQFDDNVDSDYIFSLINKNKNFDIRKMSSGYLAYLPKYDHIDSVFSLPGQVIANARIKIMETMKRIVSYPTVEICYANIDSIHISIARDKLDSFLSNHKDLISDDLGDLKVQSISDSGVWFDVGRYWLFKNGRVSQYKNILFNNPSHINPFDRRRKINYICKGDLFSYVKSVYVTIENSFSHSKRLQVEEKSVDYTNFSRYCFSEVENLHVAGETVENEILVSKSIKINLFNRVATV